MSKSLYKEYALSIIGFLLVALFGMIAPLSTKAQNTDYFFNQPLPQNTLQNQTTPTLVQSQAQTLDWRWLVPLLALPFVTIMTKQALNTASQIKYQPTFEPAITYHRVSKAGKPRKTKLPKNSMVGFPQTKNALSS